ncbi:MAG: hypothetical protein QNJ45_28240 [Ardenticatenaceae bacterium]|nr:hypothetical protein [Ardenticatenaceae bacterium]
MEPVKRYAEFCFQLRQQNQAADDFPADLPILDLKTAYAVQDALVAKLAAAHQTHLVGYKIGCTSQGAQRLLNTSGPVFGRLFARSSYNSPAALSTADFSMVVIEPEFAFEIKHDVPTGRYDAGSIRPFIATVIPSIEIVHHHLGGWDRFDAPKTVADNAIHAAWIGGQPIAEWDDVDWLTHEVNLFVNDQLVESGRGEIVLGSPLNALAWIANTLPEYGRQLKTGEIVTTGVCMNVYTAQPGETIRADFGRLGQVILKLS